MTPPTFEHAGWCNVHGEYDKPIGESDKRCTCGADERKLVWNEAVEKCAARLTSFAAAHRAAFDTQDEYDAFLEIFQSAGASLEELKVP